MTCVFHRDQDALFQCYLCRNPICVDCESKEAGQSICPRCRAAKEQRILAKYEEETRDLNYCGAVSCGLLAAVGAAVGWSQLALSFGSRADVVALVLGGLAGYAVTRGAGEKRGRDLQQIAGVLALAGILLGYFLVSLRTGWSAHIALSAGDSAFRGALYSFPDYLASLGIVGWLFLAAGVVLAYWVPHVRKPPTKRP